MARVKRDGKMERYIRAWESGQRRGLVGAGEIIAQRARNLAPRDTGRLKRSIAVSAPYPIAPYRFAVNVGTNVVYAPIQEFGGRIVPKQAKMLAIPVGDRRGSPRQYGDLVLIRTKAGQVVLIDGTGQTQYVLKHSVTIPAHPYLRPAFKQRLDKAIQTIARSILGRFREVR